MVSRVWIAIAVLALGGPSVREAGAQSRNQFGRAGRAEGAAQLVTLSVQQAISQLPPSAGQAFSFRFDPARDTFVRSDRHGPTVLLSPRTIGDGRFSARVGVSYFRLSAEFAPVFYEVSPKGEADLPPVYTKFGLEMQANVTVVDLSATYGVTRWLDAFVDVPIVVVDASASQTFGKGVVADESREFVDFLIERGGLDRQSLAERGTFPAGTNAGLGRVGLGARTSFYSNTFLELGAVTRLSFPSPSSDVLAGSDSFAIYPRVVGELFSEAPAQVYVDAGYDYDFSFAELRRFAWSVGASMPLPAGSIDLGFTGSIYDTPITWTPATAQGDPFVPDGDPSGPFADGIDMVLDEPGSNTVDNDVVNLVFGGRLELTEQFVVSAGVTVALTQNGVRPDAVGTLALEYYP